MQTVKVFVYGTLREHGSNHCIVSSAILGSEPYQIKGSLYNVGPYPAMVLDEVADQWVVGELLTIPEHALTRLDRLEGYFGPGDRFNLYDRISYQGEDGQEFYVYTWPLEKVKAKRLEKIVSGNWISYQRDLVF